MNDFSRLQKSMAYTFKDMSLLRHAMVHASVSGDDNQRLEFLGDACLGFLVARMLYNDFPHLDEGRLSRLRAFLVQKSSLVLLAEILSLADYLSVGKSYRGQKVSEKILADTFEALVAALFLDAGLEESSLFLSSLYRQHFPDVFQEGEIPKDAKTRLQEYCQARQVGLPAYSVLPAEKPAEQSFLVRVSIDSLGCTEQAVGPTKRAAEMHAAQKLMDALEGDNARK